MTLLRAGAAGIARRRARKGTAMEVAVSPGALRALSSLLPENGWALGALGASLALALGLALRLAFGLAFRLRFPAAARSLTAKRSSVFGPSAVADSACLGSFKTRQTVLRLRKRRSGCQASDRTSSAILMPFS